MRQLFFFPVWKRKRPEPASSLEPLASPEKRVSQSKADTGAEGVAGCDPSTHTRTCPHAHETCDPMICNARLTSL